MKTLLLLGGSVYLLPAIEAAHKLGARVVTCDYLPDNVAHRHADAYENASIVDREAVLAVAKKVRADGIMSYATDPGVTTAAWVAEQMGLPTSPYESVAILQNKGSFRKFLMEHGFNVPWSRTYRGREHALAESGNFPYPVIVKPVDSAGSKGVTRVDDPGKITEAIDEALAHAVQEKAFIVEAFIEKAGHSTDTDSFSVDGRLVYFSLDDQWFDENAAGPYVPAAYSWPSTMPTNMQEYLRSEVQRLLTLLRMGTSIYNIETRVGQDGKPYIMEVSPRAGGNRLAEMLRHATGQDLIMAAVKAALGLPVTGLSEPVYKGFWGEVILHSTKAGIFRNLYMSETVRPHIHECQLLAKPGDEVGAFSGANEMVGTLVLHCDTHEQLHDFLSNISGYVRVEVR